MDLTGTDRESAGLANGAREVMVASQDPVVAPGLHELLQQQCRLVLSFIDALQPSLVEQFCEEVLAEGKRLIFCGVGKSGFVGQALASMFTQVGTKAIALDPVNARRGDLVLVDGSDIVVLLSKSGSAEELIGLIPYMRAKRATIMCITCVHKCTLATLCDTSIVLPMERELCPFNLSPSTSPSLYLLFGGICKNFLLSKLPPSSRQQLALSYPSTLHGRQLIIKTKDIMFTRRQVRDVDTRSSCLDTIIALNDCGKGFVAVVDENSTSASLVGIFTDGDLRRTIQSFGYAALRMPINNFMTQNPICIQGEELAVVASQLMEDHDVTFLPVLDDNRFVGFITNHQILDSLLLNV